MNQYVRYKEYVRRPLLPPPFSLLVNAYDILNYLGRNRKIPKSIWESKIWRLEGKGSQGEHLDMATVKHCQNACKK